MSKKWLCLGACFIFLMTLVVYIPAMRAGFIWDDDAFITQNPLIKANDGLYRFWFSTEPPDYFPLTSSSIWLEWRLWGMNATGYHVVNILLHAISSMLIWLVLKILKIPGAWLAAVVFAVHPVNVESVAWITERKNTLPMVFYLLSILLYLRFETDGNRTLYGLSLGSFLLALLSKTSVVMLPFVLLGCAWWQRGRIGRKDLLGSIPFFALSGILALVTIWFQYHRAIGKDIVRTDGFFSRLAGAGWAVWFYLYKAIVPYKLSFVYPRWEIDASSMVSFLPGLLLTGLLILFWWYRKSWGRHFLFGLGYYVVTLFPVLGFFNIYFMKYSLVADHWQYTSIIGIIALLVGVGSYLFKGWKKGFRQLAIIMATVLVGILAMLTWRQEHIYKGMEALWRDTISKNPNSWMVNYSLGTVLTKQDKIDEGIEYFKKALVIKPDYLEAHTNLGNAYFKKGRLDEAIYEYKKALAINPNFAKAHTYLGTVYFKKGRLDEAISEHKQALTIDPNSAEAHTNLGVAYFSQGRLDEAIYEYKKALAINPNCAETHSNLGSAYGSQGRLDEAISECKKALAINPNYAEAHYNLEVAYYKKGNYKLAIAHCDRALELGYSVNPKILQLLKPYR